MNNIFIKEKLRKHSEQQEKLIYMLKVNDRSFRCRCGCNVFYKYKPDEENVKYYKCNACEALYVGE